CQAGAGGRAVLGDIADEQAIGIRQADGTAQPPGYVAGRYGNAQSWWCRRLAPGKRAGPLTQRLVGGDGQVETLAKAIGGEPRESPAGGQDRAAGRTGQQRGGVLQAAGDAAATRAAENPVDPRDEAERHPQSPPAGIGQSEDGGAESRGRLAGPRQR